MEKKWYYLSFCSYDKWLGATVVKSTSPKNAIGVSWEWKVNPGGKVMIIELTEEPPGNLKYKLMNLEDVKRLFGPIQYTRT